MNAEDEEKVDDPVEDEVVVDVRANPSPTVTRKKKLNAAAPIKPKRAKGESKQEKSQEQSLKTFQSLWLTLPEFKGWLQSVVGDDTKAACSACKATFNAGKSEAQKHAQGLKHQARVKSLRGTKTINEAFKGTPETLKAKKLESDVKTAEIKLATFFAEHNIAVCTADHLVELLKTTCTDSEIAKNMPLDRTKCTAVLKNVIPKTEREKNIQEIKNTKFSVLVDESTDKANKKKLVVLVRYVSKSGKVRTPLLEIIQLDSTDCSADAIYKKFKEALASHDVPIRNIIGLACDHANVMIGRHNSFFSRLKQECPWVALMDCICHSAHLAASKACKALPPFVQGTMRSIVTYTSGSPKRCAILEDFQEFFKAERKKLLKISLTRWLVMLPCVERILDNLTALEHYFLYCVAEDSEDSEAARILDALTNPFFKAYLKFLKYALAYFHKMNALFQSEKVLIHELQNSSISLMRKICQNFLRASELPNVVDVDFCNPELQVPLDKVYLGPGVEDIIDTIPIPTDPKGQLSEEDLRQRRVNDIQYFRRKCLQFYLKAAPELKRYLPMKNEDMREAAFIGPSKALSAQVRQEDLPDLPTLCHRFKDVIGLDPEKLAEEWRNMPIAIPTEKHQSLAQLEPPEFWAEVSTMQDFTEEFLFPNLVLLARTVMSLPHSNSDAERAFSVVTDTKTTKRNRLGVDTLDAICVSRSALRQDKICCFEY